MAWGCDLSYDYVKINAGKGVLILGSCVEPQLKQNLTVWIVSMLLLALGLWVTVRLRQVHVVVGMGLRHMQLTCCTCCCHAAAEYTT